MFFNNKIGLIERGDKLIPLGVSLLTINTTSPFHFAGID